MGSTGHSSSWRPGTSWPPMATLILRLGPRLAGWGITPWTRRADLMLGLPLAASSPRLVTLVWSGLTLRLTQLSVGIADTLQHPAPSAFRFASTIPSMAREGVLVMGLDLTSSLERRNQNRTWSKSNCTDIEISNKH